MLEVGDQREEGKALVFIFCRLFSGGELGGGERGGLV